MKYNKNFLLQLDHQKYKTIYAKITALNLQEYPIETIEGRVTQGSINLDGASSVRRTCSLTMVATDFNYSEYLWGFKTKFKLEIGIENTIDPQYGDIIWFKQGIYLISSFNTSRSTNNFTITIQGKDKMSMLNGDCGGTINSLVDFGSIEEKDNNGNWIIRKIPIQEIIRNMVHQYGGEPLHNIIINDLPECGYELLEYRYDTPMYLYRTKYLLNENGEIQKDEENKPILSNSIYHNATLDGTIKCKVNGSAEESILSELPPTAFDMLLEPLIPEAMPFIRISGIDYVFAKIEYGQAAGYRETLLTYAGDLIANVGETITSVLDKIKNMLGEFEYFYDLDGHFIFQQKQSFKNAIYSPINDWQDKNEDYVVALKHSEAIAYHFNGGELITTFNNNPNIANLRNDYSIWGQRNGISGTEIPIHLRYAIDHIPHSYTSIYVDCFPNPIYGKLEGNDVEAINNYNQTYGTSLTGQKSITYISGAEYNELIKDEVYQCDWREVIYQMALDYYKYNHLDDFELKVAAANPNLYPLGITGYEQYYIDLQGFWRQLYEPLVMQFTVEEEKLYELKSRYEMKKKYYLINSESNFYQLQNTYKIIYYKNANEYIQCASYQKNISDYYVDANEEDMYIIEMEYYNQVAIMENLENYYKDKSDKTEKLCWNKNVYEHPELLNFWFDFLDTKGELDQFNVKAIGTRPKAISDTNIKAIYFKDTPDILFINTMEEAGDSSAYTYIQAPGIEQMFSISAQGVSAQAKLDELIYQHGYRSESITINCIPIYYLQPNSRVHVFDEETHIDGDYIISKITIPLTYNGTMSLTATRAAESYLH